MSLTVEQLDFQTAVRDFCARECATREQREALLDPDEEDQSTPLYRKLADLGWLGVAIPEEYGGSGGTYVEQTILFEELWRGLAPVKALGPTTTVAGCYKRFGSEEQKGEALAAIADGEIMSISISEPGAGSDVAAITCTATPVSGGYVLNGQKTWCSYAHRATRILLVARTSREAKPHAGLTILQVPADAEGVETRRIATLGGREVNDVFFTDCFVSDDNVVGDVGRGFPQIMAGLDGERLLGAAVGLGLGQRALDDTIAYVKERKQFGTTIGTFQALRHRLADLATDLECARLLTYEVAARLERGPDPVTTKMTSMAKVKTSEVAKQIALEGMQMMGGYGYACEYDMESHVRHSLVLPIYAGTNEIQREIISGSLGLR
ncbi:alkylation response protein AidB-like acyl-CoA dehydrogenase [Mycolicibacterium sp. BK556]|uniref:acyl-CoA dehydrogenase family protein n=1 Tax=Mycobacteriaceae TaxID=1762 RepID=UPI00105B6D49|nr:MULTISPECIES: acyl-CoA dehydrogenase family protein [Mycobacteriaceae]MBB3600605.1 alkylation response protein AidB-like acyl-CoA dehydrogenase [Mycolicibacterium sp. BK556]MBB3630358.1 alkylation response protein AidB-like acyl-CoA dehydrogenase [Mycolicibacterium sp. BK607]MBB3748357.1 alkylation response protein AidB-like acyl-CoA dehydrogenase [Mycolicibacterium sp. BK634]TDO10147.1 alkylation response protein AidB-like acyl-CoA dehydrogenase [Mycobacterium sp. BK086]